MRKTLLAICVASTLVLGGCATIKRKLAETLISQIITGTWEKPGATKDDYFNDNWICQRDHQTFDPEKGLLLDLKGYYDCMKHEGWTLRPFSIDDLKYED